MGGQEVRGTGRTRGWGGGPGIACEEWWKKGAWRKKEQAGEGLLCGEGRIGGGRGGMGGCRRGGSAGTNGNEEAGAK